MKIIVKTFLIFILLSQSVFAESKYFRDKFNTTKKLYLGSLMSGDKKKEIEYLKKLIRYGEKLDANTVKYQKELYRLNKTPMLKNISKPVVKKMRYNISSVIDSQDSITINFTHNINKSYIKFIETKKGKNYYDEFYLKGNFKDASPTKLSIKGVDKITIYQKKKNQLAILFKHRKNLRTIYIVNRRQIIIKVLGLNIKNSSKAKVVNKNILYPARKTIVIDAGHGGHDPGAHYKNKRFEKNITLSISKYLKKDLEKKGFKVYLTRSRDKYIKLSTRTKYANKKDADMFISIHANAVPKAKANRVHGVESYFLSPARSARAKRVAALENKGDMTGMGWSSKDSLLTILNQSKITAANKMAIDIQRNMLYALRKKYGKSAIKDGGVREGPFWVLVGAQMPSVLVEIGYISHPKEGYRITTKSYQRLVAQGIANGIESYFIKN